MEKWNVGDVYAKPDISKLDIVQKFEFNTVEYKIADYGKKTLKIKGVALRGDITSKNNRKYVASELRKATNTWLNKPVNVNHDDSVKIGTVTWMDYDEPTDSLIYEAEIKNPHYVDMIRSKSAEIRGLSIQADYVFCRCSKCNKQFYTEEEWHSHMVNEEFVKDLPTEPHGIVGTGIALVLSPEVCGFDGTTYEISEKLRKEQLRLYEMIIAEKGVCGIEGTSGIAVGKAGVYTEPKEPEKPDPVTEAQAVLAAAPEPYKSAWQTVVNRMDEVVLNTPQYQQELAELKRANDLKAKELSFKELNIQESNTALESLQEQVAAQELKIVEYENRLDKVRGTFKGVALTGEQKKPVNPDLSYKPGAR